MEPKERIQYLVAKLNDKTVEAEELEELLSLLESGQSQFLLDELGHTLQHGISDIHPLTVSEDVWHDKLNAILQTDRRGDPFGKSLNTKPVYRMHFVKYAVAVSVLLIFASLFISRFFSDSEKQKVVSEKRAIAPATPDIQPGGNRATLQLSDGTVLVLDSLKKGNIAKQGSTSITKQDDGKIVYQSAESLNAHNMFNQMSTPNGGQYQLILPDGTHVWMNAASFIKYPVRFEGKNRKVEVQGELYFEVVKNPHQPFIVDEGNGVQVTVLGTHFNVNTYKSEKYTHTTLLEGLVTVTSGSSVKFLKPGEQAQVDQSGKLQIKGNVDLNAVIAWKNGLFNFNKSSTQEVMNQLARWYDIEIRYDGIIPDQMYGGEIQRDLNLSQVLIILKKSGVRCRLDRKVLTVLQ